MFGTSIFLLKNVLDCRYLFVTHHIQKNYLFKIVSFYEYNIHIYYIIYIIT